MATRSKLISDIELRLTRGKPSDDLELERSQIAHWIDITRDEIVEEFITRAMNRGEYISADYITRESCIAIIEESDSCTNSPRKTITLANKVLNLSNDKGILRVYTEDNEIVYPTSLEELEIVKDMPFTCPQNGQYLYHREGTSKLIIHGVDNNPITEPKFTVSYISKTDGSTITDDEEFPIGSDFVGILLDRVEEIGRRQLYGSLEDLDNNSEQDLNEQ